MIKADSVISEEPKKNVIPKKEIEHGQRFAVPIAELTGYIKIKSN